MGILFVLRHGYFVDEVVKSKDVTMKIRDQEILFPTSMVETIPTGGTITSPGFSPRINSPPIAFDRVTWKDMSVALFHNQEFAGLDIFSDIRVHPIVMPINFERLKHSCKLSEDDKMKIRGEEVLLPCSMIGGYPRAALAPGKSVWLPARAAVP